MDLLYVTPAGDDQQQIQAQNLQSYNSCTGHFSAAA
jgi:hypothetical protein